MSVQKLLSRDCLSGLIFAFIGIAAFIGGNRYDVGTASDMGPGYFPALMGLILIGLGAASVFMTLRSGVTVPVDWSGMKPFAAVALSVIVFALLLEPIGLVLSILIALLIACSDMVRKSPLQFAALYVALTAFCVAVFVYAFSMTIPVF